LQEASEEGGVMKAKVSHRLSLEEQETIITFDKTHNKAVIFTYEITWQKHLEKNLGLLATLDNGFGGKQYEIDKDRIKMPHAKKVRIMSPEAKEKLRLRFAEARARSKQKA
jgi:hypothetical protein